MVERWRAKVADPRLVLFHVGHLLSWFSIKFHLIHCRRHSTTTHLTQTAHVTPDEAGLSDIKADRTCALTGHTTPQI